MGAMLSTPSGGGSPPRARAVTLLDGVVRAERSDVRARRCSPAAALPALMAACVALAGCSGGSGASPASSGAPSITAPSSVGQAPDASSAPPHQQAQALTASVAPFRLPAMLSRAVAYPAGTRLLVATGLHDADRSTGAVLDIDLAGNHVTVAGRLPQAVHDAAGALLGGMPTTFGGGASSEAATIQQFVPAHRTARTAGALPVPTSDAVAASTDAGVVVAGGYDGSRTLPQVLLLTAPDRVRTLSPLPVRVRYPAVAVTGSGAGQRVLLFGGESGGVATTAVQEIDPASGSVRVVAHLPAARTQAMAVSLGGTVFVAGGAAAGTSGAQVFDDVLRYDPAVHTFNNAGRLPYPTSDAAVAVLGERAYLVGGETPARTDRTIVLAPAS